MRQLYAQKYQGQPGANPLEVDLDFAKTVESGNGKYPTRLYGRMDEFTGVMRGWVPEDIDSRYTFEGNVLTETAIVRTDELSRLLAQREPFYRFSFPPRGGLAIVAPWLFNFVVDYAISKGLDHIIDKLRQSHVKQLAKEISIEWGQNNGDPLGIIEIHFTDGSTFAIQGFPQGIDRITIKQIDEVNKALAKDKPTIVTYDSWGRISVDYPIPPGTIINFGR